MTNKIRSSTLANASVFAFFALALGAPACSTHLDDGKSGETHFLCKTDADCTRHFGNDDYLCGEANYCVPTRDGGSSGGGGGGGAGATGGAGTGGDRGTGAGGGNRGGAGGGISGSGGACICTAQGCGPGTHSVTTPGECCPHCESCAAVQCEVKSCASGETPVILPGECCATTCMRTRLTCTSGFRPEACHENDLPRCATNWAEALDRYSGLWCGDANVSLAHCGDYYAISTRNAGGVDWYFYDQAGTMVGSSGSNSMGEYCTAYTPSFMVPSDPPCGPVNAPCSASDGGSDSLCGNGVIDGNEACDPFTPKQATCAVVTMALKPAGIVKCTSTCQIDISGCHS